MNIHTISTHDVRFPLGAGHGSDAIHKDPTYSYAVTLLEDSDGRSGTGLAFTLGEGNDLVCKAAEYYAKNLQGRSIEEIMADFGTLQRTMADEQQFRWLGPHKGVVQLALASVTNACWDLWAKTQSKPLWQLLLDLEPEPLVATLDFSHIEDALTASEAVDMLREMSASRAEREEILSRGYPGYDTSIGWFGYSDEQVSENVARSVANGFDAMKLKVGSPDLERDIRRARLVREAAGGTARVMVDANQQYSVATAIQFADAVRDLDLFWFEEPVHPDDLLGHKAVAEAVAPVLVATGEHIPNRVVFKNFLQAGAMGVCQVDAVRVAGVSEFLVISLMAKKFGIPVVPHVGDMGQLHQHLVLFNHIGLGHEALFLEHIPHLREHFLNPVHVQNGVYATPHTPGTSCDIAPQES